MTNKPPAQEVVRDIPVEYTKPLTGNASKYCITHCPECRGNHVTVRHLATQRVCPYCFRMPISEQGDLGVLCLTYQGRVMSKDKVATRHWRYLAQHLLLSAAATAAEVHVGRRQARRQGLDYAAVADMVRNSDMVAAINND